MIRKFLSASLIFLQILTQTASAMEFQPVITQSIPLLGIQVPSDILENKNLGSSVTPFLFSKISESVVNQPLVFDQGFRISSNETSDEMLSPSGWWLTRAYYASFSSHYLLKDVPLVEQNGFASKSLARFWQSRSLLGVHSGSSSGFNETAVMNDKLNRVASETQKFGTLSFAVTSVYDKAGNRTKVTYPSTKNAEYVYNALIRSPTLRSIRLPWLITRTMF